MKLLATTALLIGFASVSAAAQATQPISISLPSPTAGVNLRPGDKLESKLQGKLDHAYDNAWRHLEGQPFIQRSWQPGEIVLNNKQRIGDLLLQYDAYGQQLLGIRKGKADTLQLDHNVVQSFVVKDELSPDRMRTFRRFENASRPEERLNFVEVLHAGNYSLLKRHGRQFHQAGDGQALNGDTNNDRIAEVNTYYLSRPDGSVVPVKLNPKALSAAAPDLAAAIKAELASKKADNSEAGMAALLDSVDEAH